MAYTVTTSDPTKVLSTHRTLSGAVNCARIGSLRSGDRRVFDSQGREVAL